MIDHESLERAAERFQPPERSFERLVVRRERKVRGRRLVAGLVAISFAAASLIVLLRAFPATETTEPAHHPADIFSGVRGWIAYGDRDGIWAVDPDRPGDRQAKVRLSPLVGQPIAWARDGSALLVMRAVSYEGTLRDPGMGDPRFNLCLRVIDADGTEHQAAAFARDTLLTGYALSPDGSQVVFSTQEHDSDVNSIYVVDADGGTPRLIRSTLMEPFVLPEIGWRGMLLWPAWSPDGARIAYFHGGGDHTENLKVMNADGTGSRGRFGDMRLDAHVQGLEWSPDGSQLAFATDDPDGIWGIWVIKTDGTGYRRVVIRGEDPSWSPDGSRISFRRAGTVFTVKVDGSDLRRIGRASRDGTIAWNPVG